MSNRRRENAMAAVTTVIRHVVDKSRISEVDNPLTIAPWNEVVPA
jgi:hypothetical protein